MGGAQPPLIQICVYCTEHYDDDDDSQLTSVQEDSMQFATDRPASPSSSSLDSDGDDVMITSAWREFLALPSDSDDDVDELSGDRDVVDGVGVVMEPDRKRYKLGPMACFTCSVDNRLNFDLKFI